MFSMKRAFVGLSVSGMAAAALVAGGMASPAHATAADCQTYLKDRHYTLYPKLINACAVGAKSHRGSG
ncbi:hypothetical protein ACZ90_64180 [Streptomyces albus subsp. albus]|nr:hypothetical protein ACZ90_64180 [Streptomyces albus subsp. albus]